ncbi:hypothetical protein [uncultured Nocardioides sp.]|uniref:hypothetical protein n=1 Tax=uncultured Nocardioides sp. TaxID=198441 RepID=UPI002614C25B|nr:hypothetical protein [uncultured Nocardioides sp.]
MSLKTSLTARRGLATVALVALATGTLGACSTDSGTDAQSAGSSSSDASPVSQSEQGPPQPVASIDSLTGDDTEVALDEGFTTALGDLGLTPGTVGDGKLTNAGALRFPVTGGNVTVFEPGEVSPYVIGQVQHEGSGFSLTAGQGDDQTVVEIENLNVDPGVSRVYGDVTVNGELAAASAYIFSLNGNTLQPLQTEGDTAVLEGSEVYVSPVAAGLLNDTFGTDAVTEDLLVGIATVTVNTTPGD